MEGKGWDENALKRKAAVLQPYLQFCVVTFFEKI